MSFLQWPSRAPRLQANHPMLRTELDAVPPASAPRGTGIGFADAAGFALPAYRAAPEGDGPFPVILVVSEIFGVHAHIADVARRFAKLGYLAIAPELFVRQGDAKSTTDINTLFATVISKVPDAQVMADLDACVAWAAANGGDVRRLGIT